MREEKKGDKRRLQHILNWTRGPWRRRRSKKMSCGMLYLCETFLCLHRNINSDSAGAFPRLPPPRAFEYPPRIPPTPTSTLHAPRSPLVP